MQNEQFYERNEKLIRERLTCQIDEALEKGNKYIDNELSGPFYMFIKPIVKMFYNTIKKKDMAKGAVEQIDTILKAAKTGALKRDKPIDEIIDEYFHEYLKEDQTTKSLKKNHKNFLWCTENQKNTFRTQIIPLIEMLKCEEPKVMTYADLTIATFKTKSTAMDALTGQLRYMNLGLEKIREDLSILDLPVGQDVLFKVLKRGYEDTWAELIEELNTLPFN